MPLYGVVHDSPFFYYARKGLHVKSRPRSRSSYAANINVSYTFSKVVLYKPILNYELNVPTGMVGVYMHGIGAQIMAGARRQVGVQTGALRRSIHLEHRGHPNGQTIKIGSNLPYALMHHQGTAPHTITPNPPNKILKFSSGSKVIRTAQVRHPGTKANRFLSDQLRVHIR